MTIDQALDALAKLQVDYQQAAEGHRQNGAAGTACFLRELEGGLSDLARDLDEAASLLEEQGA
jgi:hypothetical protein